MIFSENSTCNLRVNLKCVHRKHTFSVRTQAAENISCTVSGSILQIQNYYSEFIEFSNSKTSCSSCIIYSISFYKAILDSLTSGSLVFKTYYNLINCIYNRHFK